MRLTASKQLAARRGIRRASKQVQRQRLRHSRRQRSSSWTCKTGKPSKPRGQNPGHPRLPPAPQPRGQNPGHPRRRRLPPAPRLKSPPRLAPLFRHHQTRPATSSTQIQAPDIQTPTMARTAAVVLPLPLVPSLQGRRPTIVRLAARAGPPSARAPRATTRSARRSTKPLTAPHLTTIIITIAATTTIIRTMPQLHCRCAQLHCRCAQEGSLGHGMARQCNRRWVLLLRLPARLLRGQAARNSPARGQAARNSRTVSRNSSRASRGSRAMPLAPLRLPARVPPRSGCCNRSSMPTRRSPSSRTPPPTTTIASTWQSRMMVTHTNAITTSL